jgi:S1-C subfamily serine protease
MSALDVNPAQHPRPRQRSFSRVAVALGALALVVLAAIGLVSWGVGRSSVTGSATVVTAPSTQSPPAGPASVAAQVSPGLVDINTVLGYQGARAAGTGIVLTSDGEVLTNNHVVEGATQIQVTDIGNGQTYQATTVGYDRTHDIAVLRLQGASGLTTTNTGDSTGVAVGDHILGIGNAGGVGGTPSVANGTITALDQSITATDESGGNSETLTGLIQVEADIQAGDSGGPLVNSTGQVIGVDTAASAGNQLDGQGGAARAGEQAAPTQGFAIPINDALAVAHQIDSGTASSTVHIGATAMLGVSAIAAGPLGIDTGAGPISGAVAEQVLPGGPAAQAGLGTGDVITAVDGQPIDSATTLTTVLDHLHPGDTVTLTWLDRALQQHAVAAVLATGPVG